MIADAIVTPEELLESSDCQRRNKYAMKDLIIAEIRHVREVHAKRFNYDVYAILRDLKERQIKNGRKTVSLPPKRLKPVGQTAYATTPANT